MTEKKFANTTYAQDSFDRAIRMQAQPLDKSFGNAVRMTPAVQPAPVQPAPSTNNSTPSNSGSNNTNK